MRITRSPWTAGAAVLAAASLVLTGCSAGGNDAPAGDFTLGEVPADEATLTVWTFLPGNYDGGDEAYDKVIDGFTDLYPQITIDLVDMPYPTFWDQLRNASVSRQGPDVVTMYGGAQAYSYRTMLHPLQNAMSDELQQDLRFVDENYSQDGNLYMLPTGTYGYALLVNQDLFAQAGVDPEAGLADWDSFLGTCEALAAKGIQPIGSGWLDGFLLETMLYMFSSQLMDPDTLDEWVAGDLPVTDDVFTKSIDYTLAMNDAGCFGGDDALGRAMWNDSFDQYFGGNAAMLVAGGLSRGEEGYASIPSTTVMALPMVPDAPNPRMIDAGAEAGWGVTQWTEHPEAAAAFVNYLASPDAQQILWETVSVPPNLGSITVEATTPIEEVYLPLLANDANHTGFASFPLTVLAIVEREAAPLISGTITTDEFFQQLDRAFQRG